MENNDIATIEVILEDGAYMPKKSNPTDIGYDLYTMEDSFIKPYGRCVVPTGVHINLPVGVEAQVRPKSGMSAKGMIGEGLRMTPCKIFGFIPFGEDAEYVREARWDCDVLLGTVDPAYKDGIGVLINNHDKGFMIPRGTRIAQLVFNKVQDVQTLEVGAFSDTVNRGGGFGHTGVN